MVVMCGRVISVLDGLLCVPGHRQTASGTHNPTQAPYFQVTSTRFRSGRKLLDKRTFFFHVDESVYVLRYRMKAAKII